MGRYTLIFLSIAALIPLSLAAGGKGDSAGAPVSPPKDTGAKAGAGSQGGAPNPREGKFANGHIMYDMIHPKMKADGVILDARDIPLTEIVKLINDEHTLKGFGAIVVTAAKDGVKAIDAAIRKKLDTANIRLYAYIPKSMVVDDPLYVEAVMEKMFKAPFYVQGFFLDSGLPTKSQENIATELRELCKKNTEINPGEQNIERSEIYEPGKSSQECPMLVHEYGQDDANNLGLKTIKDAPKLLSTGRLLNDAYRTQINKSLLQGGKLSDLEKLHEGGCKDWNNGCTSWAEYYVINRIVAGDYTAKPKVEEMAVTIPFVWPYGANKLDGFLTKSGTKYELKHKDLIKKLMGFHSAVQGRPVNNVGGDQNVFYFARDQAGFVIMNNGTSEFDGKNIQTRLPAGSYENLLNTVQKITVKAEGTSDIKVPAQTVMLFVIKGKVKPEPVEQGAEYKITEFLLHAPETNPGEYIYLRGAWEQNQETCTKHESHASCFVDIFHDTPASTIMHGQYNDCKVNNKKLQWHYDQPHQGTHNGVLVKGVPMVWTTCDPENPLHNKANAKGPGYWYLRIRSKCPVKVEVNGKKVDKTNFFVKANSNAWFAAKNNEWEGEQGQSGQNHEVECGKRNIMEWGVFGKAVTEDIPVDPKKDKTAIMQPVAPGDRIYLDPTDTLDVLLDKLAKLKAQRAN